MQDFFTIAKTDFLDTFQGAWIFPLLLIVLVFVLIFIVSNAIIDVSYYTYFEHMMADKLSQSVEVASSSYTQSFFDTIKREAVKLVTEEPLKNFLDGSNAPEDT